MDTSYVSCRDCGLLFAHPRAKATHRIADGRCIDVRADTAWHIDNHGAWTDQPHRGRTLWPEYALHDDAQEVRYRP